MNLAFLWKCYSYPPPKESPIGILIDITLNLYVILRKKKKISFYYPVFPSGNIDESIFSSSVLCSVLQFSLYGPCWSKDGGDWRDFEEALKKDKGSWPDSAESCVIWHFTQLSWPHFPQVPVELNSHLVELWELGGVCVKSIQNWDKN